MDSMAQAWDAANETMVYVDSVYGGEYVVRGQWTDRRYVADIADLRELWINTEIIDTFDEFVKNFGITDSYFMVAAIVRNSAWAQAIAKQWAGLY